MMMSTRRGRFVIAAIFVTAIASGFVAATAGVAEPGRGLIWSPTESLLRRAISREILAAGRPTRLCSMFSLPGRMCFYSSAVARMSAYESRSLGQTMLRNLDLSGAAALLYLDED